MPSLWWGDAAHDGRSEVGPEWCPFALSLSIYYFLFFMSLHVVGRPPRTTRVILYGNMRAIVLWTLLPRASSVGVPWGTHEVNAGQGRRASRVFCFLRMRVVSVFLPDAGVLWRAPLS